MLNIKKISSCSEGFSEKIKKHISQRKVNTNNIKGAVKDIISEVRVNGDQALIKFCSKFWLFREILGRISLP